MGPKFLANLVRVVTTKGPPRSNVPSKKEFRPVARDGGDNSKTGPNAIIWILVESAWFRVSIGRVVRKET